MKKNVICLFIFIYLFVFESKAQLIPEGVFAGKVYHDVNGSTDGLVNGLNLPFEVRMLLNGQTGGTFDPVDIAQLTINSGEFSLSAIAGTYNLSIDLTSIPNGWQLTSPPSILFSDNELGWSVGSTTNYFGISKIPVIPLNGEGEFTNPNGSTELNIPLPTFGSTDDGTIQKIIIFGGTGYLSITINGTVYDATNPIPPTGVEVITENAGGRLLPGTISINPTVDGATTATINYKVVDNANLTSNTGTITLNIVAAFTSICSPISSTNSLETIISIPEFYPITGSTPAQLRVNDYFDPLLYTISRDIGTAYFTYFNFTILGQTTNLNYIYRQNNVWRFSSLNFTNGNQVYFSNLYQCTSGFFDAFPPCDAIWESVNTQNWACTATNPNGLSCMPYPDWPVGLSATISGAVNNVNFPQPCTFQQNNTTIIGGVPKYLWNDPANWSCGEVPATNKAIYIPAGQVVTLNASLQSKSILNNGVIELNGFTITNP